MHGKEGTGNENFNGRLVDCYIDTSNGNDLCKSQCSRMVIDYGALWDVCIRFNHRSNDLEPEMNRFDWSPTIELEPGVTYIPAEVDDNGRERMINCRCWCAPLFREDIEGEKAVVNPQQLQQRW